MSVLDIFAELKHTAQDEQMSVYHSSHVELVLLQVGVFQILEISGEKSAVN